MNGLILRDLMGVEITGTASAFPDGGKWISNEDIHSMLFGGNWKEKMAEKNLDPCYYEKELGFKKRYWVHTPGAIITHDELTSADLMVEAANKAIVDSGIKKEEIDFIIAVTITSPKYTTAMGPYVAGELGINTPAIEMKSGCASNMFSITFAAQLIQNGARNVLIVGGETITKILKMNSTMAYAGGDAGAAVILSKSFSKEKGIAVSLLNSNGSYSSYMGMKGLMPPNKKDFDDDNYYMSFYEGTEEFLQSVWSAVPGILYDTLKINSGDIDCFIPHQVHKKRTIMAGNAACIPEDKTINIIGDIANCGSVTILVALDYARKNNRLKKDQTALLVAAGGGISWGGLILKT